MASKSIPFAALGRQFEIRFGSQAIIEVENAADNGFGRVIRELQSEVRLGTVRIMLAASVTDAGERVDLDTVDQVLEDLGMERAIALIAEALNASFLASSPKPAGKAPPGKRAA